MITKKPRPHQIEAVEKALPHPGFAFWLEQRTGKTLCSLMLADKRKPNWLFIVTTKKGRKVWEREIEASLKIDWECVVTIIHYQELHTYRKKYREAFRHHGVDGIFIICDESHMIKRRGSRHARVVRSLGKLAQWRLALTGTPLAPRSRTKRRKRTGPELKVTMGLEDAWAQFDFINPDIFGEHDQFCAKYLVKGGFRGFQTVGYRNKKEFYRLFHRYSFRKLLREVQERPTLVCRKKLRFDLKPKTREIYDSMDKKMYAMVNGNQVKIPLVVSRTQKLQQIASGFLIDTENDRKVLTFGSEKLRRLEKELKIIFSPGHREKVVICAKFIQELNQVEGLISRMGLTHQTIKGKTEFDGKFKVDVTLMQIQSGVAIDLAQARTFIFYSCGHNFIDYEQARFRVLSYDKRQVNFYYLLANDTIDELVYEAQTKKKNLATLVFDYYRRIENEQSDRIGSRIPLRVHRSLRGRR